MKTTTRLFLGVTVLALAGILGCTYDQPITSKPTRKIEPGLIGNWVAADNKDNDKKDSMQVRKLDDSHFVLTHDGEFYRAYHSEVAGLPLVSVQALEGERKYAYMAWKLSADGKELTLQIVQEEVISKDLETSAAVRKAFKANAKNPNLFEEPVKFVRE